VIAAVDVQHHPRQWTLQATGSKLQTVHRCYCPTDPFWRTR
jgi:hypothetical protein